MLCGGFNLGACGKRRKERGAVAVIRKQKRTQRSSQLKVCVGYGLIVCIVFLVYRSSFGTTTSAPVRSKQTNLDPATEDLASLKLKSNSELKSSIKPTREDQPVTTLPLEVSTGSSNPLKSSGMSSFATISTEHGNIKFRFRDDKAPKHAAFMRQLIGEGLYNGCVFYRAEQNFVLQGGLRDAAGNQRSKKIDNPPLEFDLLNKRGTVTMARWEDTNSGSGEFFINLRDSPHLDRTGSTGWALGFTVFGEVVEGMEVAEKIGMLPTTVQGGLKMLNTPVVMNSVTLS